MLQSLRARIAGAAGIAFLAALAACDRSGATPAATAAPNEAAAAEPAADTHGFTVRTEVIDEGDTTFLQTTVRPTSGYKLNMEYPRWSVAVAESAPVAAGVRSARDEAREFTEDVAVFRIPVTDCPTEGTVDGELRLSVCNDEACLTPTETIAWNLAERP